MKKRGLLALLVVLAMLLPSIPVFAASYFTVSGTISLPSGFKASNGDYVEVALIPQEWDGNEIIRNSDNDRSYYDYWTDYDLKEGATSITYSVSAESGGSYILYFEASITGMPRRYEYYTASGNVSQQLLAEPIILNSNRTINTTLSKPERTISGTLTLDPAPSRDGYIRMTAFPQNSGSYTDVKIPVTAGSSSVSYSIPVDKGIYTLRIDGSGYLRTDYKFGYSTNYYINTQNSSMTLPNATASNYNVSSSSSGGSGGGYDDDDGRVIPITIVLPNGAPSGTYCEVDVFTEEYENYDWFDNSEGNSGYIYVPNGNFILRVWAEGSNSAKYYSVSGLTDDRSEATVFNDSTQRLYINLSSEFMVISGTVQRNGAAPGKRLRVDVSLEIPSEENDQYVDSKWFYKTLSFGKTQTSAYYSLLVPKEYSGRTARLFADAGRNPITDEQTVTVASMTRNITILPDSFKKISGTVTLSSAAPKYGVAVSILGNYDYNSHYFYIPQGQKTINYDFYTDKDSTRIECGTYSEDSRFNSGRISVDISDNNTANAVIPVDTKTVRGNIKIEAADERTEAVSYRIEVRNDTGSSLSGFGTIDKNSSSASYSVNIPSDWTNADVSIDILNSVRTGMVSMDSYDDVEIPASGTLSNINFTLFDKMLIYFDAQNMPETTDEDSMTATVELDNGTTHTADFNDDGTATVVFSSSELGNATEFKAYYSANIHSNDNNVYEYDNMYINPDGTLTQNEDEAVSYPIKAQTNIDFILENNSVLLDESDISFGGVTYDETDDTVNIQFKNYDGTVYNATAIVTVYDENNALVYTEPHIIKIDDSFEAEFTSAIKDKLPAGGYANLLIWQNIGNIKPIDDVTLLYSDNQD